MEWVCIATLKSYMCNYEQDCHQPGEQASLQRRGVSAFPNGAHILSVEEDKRILLTGFVPS